MSTCTDMLIMMLEVQYYFRSQGVCARMEGTETGARHSLPGQTFTRFFLKVWLARPSKAVLPTLDGAVIQFVF